MRIRGQERDIAGQRRHAAVKMPAASPPSRSLSSFYDMLVSPHADYRHAADESMLEKFLILFDIDRAILLRFTLRPPITRRTREAACRAGPAMTYYFG